MFFAACEGYFDKLDDTAALFRNLSAVVNRSMGGKADMEKIWPLHSDKQHTSSDIMKPWTKEEVKAMTDKANKIFANG